jgi:hypothetical protein
MQIIELNEPLILKGSGVPRTTSTIHVTDIIKSLAQDLGRKEGSVDLSGAPVWDLNLAAEMGFLWEDVLEWCLGERMAPRPGEMELDSIVGSPDGFNWTDWELEEYKLTWRSCNEQPGDANRWWKWLIQAKSYCKMFGKSLCGGSGRYPTVLWRVLYVVGDWKGSGPKLKQFRATFGEMEIEENWELLVRQAKRKGWL